MELALVCYNMLSQHVPIFVLDVAMTIRTKGKQDGLANIRRSGLKPELQEHQSAIGSVFGGRYTFSQYFLAVPFYKLETIEPLNLVIPRLVVGEEQNR